ncbi:MAG: tetratricopeptide repeat protein, partial [Caldilineaceae bacterium]
QFGLLGDAEMLFQDAAERFQQDEEQRELVAQLLHQQWRFTRALRGMTVAEDLLHRVLATSQDAALQLQIHSDLSTGYAEAGAWADANFHFDAAEALARQLTDPLAYIRTVESRIHVNALHFRGDLQQGIVRLQEMFPLLDAIPDPGAAHENMRFQLNLSLALVAMRYGDYALALQHSLSNLDYVTRLKHRHKRVWCLLDLALIEQFAGLYPAAVEHNLEALSLAEEINALDDLGLLSANFCLMLRPMGKLEEGLAYGQRGAQILHGLGIARQEGQARNRIGHTLLALRRWDEAYAAYAAALTVWEPLQHPNHIEAVAGRAVAAHRLGDHHEALRLVDEALSFVESNGLIGVVEPVLLLLHCEDVLRGLGESTRAGQVLQTAISWVDTIAGRISDEDVRVVPGAAGSSSAGAAGGGSSTNVVQVDIGLKSNSHEEVIRTERRACTILRENSVSA